MNLVFIYGPPASGKLTVARRLSEETGYKLFHNHLIFDLVTSLFDFYTEKAGELSSRFRVELLEEAAKANLDGVVFTYVYAKGPDDAFVQRIIDAVEGSGGKILFVLLKASKEELLQRVTSESRKEFKKIHAPEKLSELLEQYNLISPVLHRESLVIDNAALSANDVVQQIVSHYNLPHNS